LASAQPAPPPDQQGPPTGAAQQRDPQRIQFMAQMRRLHQQMRSSVLEALTPTNRQLLAEVVGQLAIAPSPNYKGAVQRLDRALSPAERNTILQADDNLRTQSQALFASMQSSGQQGGQMPPGADGQMPPGADGQMPPGSDGQAPPGSDGQAPGPDGAQGAPMPPGNPGAPGPGMGKRHQQRTAGQVLLAMTGMHRF
jgi:hypothetical protein